MRDSSLSKQSATTATVRETITLAVSCSKDDGALMTSHNFHIVLFSGVRDWRSFYRYAIHFIYLEVRD